MVLMHIHPYDGPMAKQKTDGHTPLRPLRIPDDEWEAFGQLVGDRNRTQAVREFIRWRLRWPASKQPERATEQIGGPGITSKSKQEGE